MNRLRMIWTIAVREFREQTRSRIFRISTAMTILIVVAAVVFPALASNTDRTPVFDVGVVQPIAPEIIDAMERTGPGLGATVRVTAFPDIDSGKNGLLSDAIVLLVVPGQEVLARSTPDPSTANSVNRLSASLSEPLRLYSGLEKVGLTPAESATALSNDPLPLRGLEAAPIRNAKNAQASTSGMILLFVFLTLYGAFVLNSVIEEKTSRVVEILLATVKPFDLLAGKVLGIGMIGSVQGVALVVAALVSQAAVSDASGSLTPIVVLYTLLWFALGFLLFAGLYACAGALVSRAVDAQSLVMPLQIPLVASYVVGLYAAINGDNSLVVVMSLFPFTAPMTMLERMSAGEAPVWQILLSISLTLITALGVLRLAVTIFAGGILRSGQRVRIRDAWRQ